MSGIEPEAFKSACGLLSEGSILENSCINILRINGKGIYIACGKEFEMNRRMDTGPYCHHNIYSDGLCKRMIPWQDKKSGPPIRHIHQSQGLFYIKSVIPVRQNDPFRIGCRSRSLTNIDNIIGAG